MASRLRRHSRTRSYVVPGSPRVGMCSPGLSLPPRPFAPMSATVTYALTGRLDGFTSATHETELKDLLAGDASSVTIDLRQLEYVSSAGLRVLLMTAKMAKAKGGSVVLSEPTSVVLDVLKISGFDKIFEIRNGGV
jgi:anti-anti-sigma factor